LGIRTLPGEILREEYLAPLKMSAHELAATIGVPANRISEIVHESSSVTADTALRLARYAIPIRASVSVRRSRTSLPKPRARWI